MFWDLTGLAEEASTQVIMNTNSYLNLNLGSITSEVLLLSVLFTTANNPQILLFLAIFLYFPILR